MQRRKEIRTSMQENAHSKGRGGENLKPLVHKQKFLTFYKRQFPKRSEKIQDACTSPKCQSPSVFFSGSVLKSSDFKGETFIRPFSNLSFISTMLYL